MSADLLKSGRSRAVPAGRAENVEAKALLNHQ
jgi:hypothetical protein